MAYDISRRVQINNVGELRALLENYTDDTDILCCGDNCVWFHVEGDSSVVNLDYDSLDDAYEEVD